MYLQATFQYVAFFLVVTALIKPCGAYMARVFQGQPTFMDQLCRPLEKVIYRITRVNPAHEMDWKEYAQCFVLFGLTGTLLLYAILRVQHLLGWLTPPIATPMTPDLAMNIGISFSTTTT